MSSVQNPAAVMQAAVHGGCTLADYTGKTALIWQARVRKAKELEVHVYDGPAS